MPERKRPTGKPRHREENNIETDLKVLGWEDADWIIWLTTGVSDGFIEYVNEASAFLKFGIRTWNSLQLLASQERVPSMQFHNYIT
jgi:hypothetical protein